MTNKMPIVGKRYRTKSEPFSEVGIIYLAKNNREICFEGKNGLSVSLIESFLEFFEELPPINRAFATVVGNPDGSCTMIDFTEAREEKEVSEVKRALKDLKNMFSCPKRTPDFYTIQHSNWKAEYFRQGFHFLQKTAQNLVNALEAEKAKTHQLNTPVSCKYTPPPQSKIFVDQGKVGGDYTAKARVSKDENGNFTVHEIVIEEPKIDMKEECVEPVNIKKETYRCAHDYVLKNQGYNNRDHLIREYECNINFFEQMQKDIEELKRK